jgi:hypothetical protein
MEKTAKRNGNESEFKLCRCGEVNIYPGAQFGLSRFGGHLRTYVYVKKHLGHGWFAVMLKTIRYDGLKFVEEEKFGRIFTLNRCLCYEPSFMTNGRNMLRVFDGKSKVTGYYIWFDNYFEPKMELVMN